MSRIPNVTMSWFSWGASMMGAIAPRWIATPRANSATTASGMTANGVMPSVDETAQTMYIATTIIAPCAKLITSMTPKIRVRPSATSP
jgi:hypothetical protein